MKRVDTPFRRRQGGATLVIAMVMMVALAMLAVWGYNASTMNARAVANTNARQEAFSAAQAALEATISSAQFIENPVAVAANPVPLDLDGDGVADATAHANPPPSCSRVRPVSATELDPTVSFDAVCFLSQRPSGIEPMSPGVSLCADSEWNVRATVTEASSGASVAVNQGVALRSLATDAMNACP